MWKPFHLHPSAFLVWILNHSIEKHLILHSRCISSHGTWQWKTYVIPLAQMWVEHNSCDPAIILQGDRKRRATQNYVFSSKGLAFTQDRWWNPEDIKGNHEYFSKITLVSLYNRGENVVARKMLSWLGYFMLVLRFWTIIM